MLQFETKTTTDRTKHKTRNKIRNKSWLLIFKAYLNKIDTLSALKISHANKIDL